MKSHRFCIAFIIFICTLGPAFSQTLRYTIDTNTDEILSIEKFIINYNYSYHYDEDFERITWRGYIGNVSYLIEKSNNKNGRLIYMSSDTKRSYTILNCYKVNYKNNNDSYIKIKCQSQAGKIFYYYLDLTSKMNIWFNFNGNVRNVCTNN